MPAAQAPVPGKPERQRRASPRGGRRQRAPRDRYAQRDQRYICICGSRREMSGLTTSMMLTMTMTGRTDPRRWSMGTSVTHPDVIKATYDRHAPTDLSDAATPTTQRRVRSWRRTRRRDGHAEADETAPRCAVSPRSMESVCWDANEDTTGRRCGLHTGWAMGVLHRSGRVHTAPGCPPAVLSTPLGGVRTRRRRAQQPPIQQTSPARAYRWDGMCAAPTPSAKNTQLIPGHQTAYLFLLSFQKQRDVLADLVAVHQATASS